MAGWRIQGGGRLRAIAAIVVGAACLSSAPALAQATAYQYEKQLDLGVNPTPSTGERELLALAPLSPGSEPLSLPALVPLPDIDLGRDLEDSPRILMGTPSRPGTWRSALYLNAGYRDASGQQKVSRCGASLIDASWALTAAHCVFRRETGGLRGLLWVTAYGDDVRAKKGKVLRVKAVYVQKQYKDNWILNDLALLQLEHPTMLPRQKLAGGLPSEVLDAGSMATIIGWGRTKGDDPDSLSPVLLEASVPVASRAACDAFRKTFAAYQEGRPLTDAELCVGSGEAPLRTCSGDSGGPVFVSGPTGEPIQAGIVSWGRKGCKGYSVVASPGYFETWIGQHVPSAVFALPHRRGTDLGAAGPLATIAGAVPGGPPSPHGQCTLDVYVDGAATNVVKVGSELSVRLTSGVTGRVAVYSTTGAGKVIQLHPSKLGGGGPHSEVPAGATLDVPERGFTLKVTPPLGRYAVIAIVLAGGDAFSSVVRQHADMRPIEDFSGLMSKLTQLVRSMPPNTPRAVCTRQFDVTE